MKYVNRWVVAVASASFFYACSPVIAQWQVPDNTVPIGRGSGTGFKSTTAGTNNQAFMGSTGGSPSFRALTGADLPSPFTSGTASGNTSKFATTTGTLTNGNCVKLDANGNFVDAGAACGTGGGGGTGTVTSVNCFGSSITVSGTCTTAATKSDQQTATSATAVVTPSQQQSHPSAVKAWAFIAPNGSVTSGYNVASATNPSTGTYTVNFATAFASTPACIASSFSTGDTGGLARIRAISELSATILTSGLAGSAGTPAIGLSIVCLGTQ